MVTGWSKRAAASLRAVLETTIRSVDVVPTVIPPSAGLAQFSGFSALGSPVPRQLTGYSSPWSLLQRRWTTGSGKGVPVTTAVSFPKAYRSRVAASAVVTHKYGPDVLHDPVTNKVNPRCRASNGNRISTVRIAKIQLELSLQVYVSKAALKYIEVPSLSGRLLQPSSCIARLENECDCIFVCTVPSRSKDVLGHRLGATAPYNQNFTIRSLSCFGLLQ